MAGGLTEATRAELDELAHRFGEPRVVDTVIDDRFHEPIWKRDWAAWGRFRAIVHRVVHAALSRA